LIFEGQKVYGQGDVWIQNGHIKNIGKKLNVLLMQRLSTQQAIRSYWTIVPTRIPTALP